MKSLHHVMPLAQGKSTAQPRNRATAQPRNRATAQPRNRATAQPRNSEGESFTQPLPNFPRLGGARHSVRAEIDHQLSTLNSPATYGQRPPDAQLEEYTAAQAGIVVRSCHVSRVTHNGPAPAAGKACGAKPQNAMCIVRKINFMNIDERQMVNVFHRVTGVLAIPNFRRTKPSLVEAVKYRKCSISALWFFILLYMLSSHIGIASNNLGNSNLPEVQTNLVRLYGIRTKSIVAVPLADIKSILESPPNIKDAIFTEYDNAIYDEHRKAIVFSGTNYYRGSFASNGYCLAVGTAPSDLANLSALGDVRGRFGVTNWHASGGGIVFGNGMSGSQTLLGRGRSSLACEPLRLGILPLLVGSVRFQDTAQFQAKDAVGGKVIKGQLIMASNRQSVLGIEYEIEGITGWSYIITFLSNSESSSNNTSFPLWRWASFSVGPTETNLMVLFDISRIEVTSRALTDNYFRPSQWLSSTSSIPTVNAYIVKHQIMVKRDHQLVPAMSGVTAKSPWTIHIIQAAFVLLGIIPCFLAARYLIRKSK